MRTTVLRRLISTAIRETPVVETAPGCRHGCGWFSTGVCAFCSAPPHFPPVLPLGLTETHKLSSARPRTWSLTHRSLFWACSFISTSASPPHASPLVHPGYSFILVLPHPPTHPSMHTPVRRPPTHPSIHSPTPPPPHPALTYPRMHPCVHPPIHIAIQPASEPPVPSPAGLCVSAAGVGCPPHPWHMCGLNRQTPGALTSPTTCPSWPPNFRGHILDSTPPGHGSWPWQCPKK